MSISPILRKSKSRPTREGAGVNLHRGFGFGDTELTDPFLLFDDFRGDKGILDAGSVQWMTAGSGIAHQEMPSGGTEGRVHGFQLWANLPRELKMSDPRYQDIPSSEVIERSEDDGTFIRLICGEWQGLHGPVPYEAGDDVIAYKPVEVDNRSLVVFDSGDEIRVTLVRMESDSCSYPAGLSGNL